MRFREFYLTEGRNKWSIFEIKKTAKRWSIYNTETNKRYYIKLGEDPANVGSMQKFLEDILATNETRPKTRGEIDFKEFATSVVTNEKAKIHVKSGNWDRIKKTWVIG